MFKSLKNARRIASISNELRGAFESLTFATATKEAILSLIRKVKEKHDEKVAQSLAEEIFLEPQNEVELFRTKNIITIARGFLLYRETMKKKVSKLADEILELENTTITLRARVDSAFSTPWSQSIHRDGLLINADDILRAREIQRKIERNKAEIKAIKEKYFVK